ncbi:MAG TPA: cation-transporting P-type ATPase, partial [Candidatus Tectomicrobia bacterium]
VEQHQGRDSVVPWHHHDVQDVMERLETDRHGGLTVEEAERRLAREGPNRERDATCPRRIKVRRACWP